jgi:hypothetical protein
MPDLVGVMPLRLASEDLKRQLLAFDRIAQVGLNSWIEQAPDADQASLQWLIEQGVLFDPKLNLADLAVALRGEVLSADVEHIATDLHWLDSDPEHRTPIGQRRVWEMVRKELDQLQDSSVATWDLDFDVPQAMRRARALSVIVRRRLGINAVPIGDYAQVLGDSQATNTVVLQIVINELPIPNDGCSLPDILEFKRDASEQGLTQALRVWVNEITRGGLTAIEVTEKLEELLVRHKKHLEVHRMKADVGVLETIVVTPAEVAEHFMKLKWGKLARTLFGARVRRAELMKEELELPGREVAYIVKARERFGG